MVKALIDIPTPNVEDLKEITIAINGHAYRPGNHGFLAATDNAIHAHGPDAKGAIENLAKKLEDLALDLREYTLAGEVELYGIHFKDAEHPVLLKSSDDYQGVPRSTDRQGGSVDGAEKDNE